MGAAPVLGSLSDTVHDVPTRVLPGAPAGAPPRLDVADGTTIGRFELIRELARGGMGQVFLGRDTKLARKVAIKFLLHDDAQFLQHFLVEARATARCTHENIVTIHEVGDHQGLPYMVLEYLEGKTLSDVLDTKPPPRQFVELMVPVARALERAHEHGIVHRDLKPSNIFVTDRGQVKVLDFGIARIVDRNDADLDELVGTVPYMSPEQFGAGEVDHLSDIWAFGIICWRALVGVHPSGSMVPQVLRARVCDPHEPMPSIGARDPSLPRELVAIVDRCLAKRKEQRYHDAGELLRDLQAFLSPRGERPGDEISPYRGLSAFGEVDAQYFFGRTNEIRTALGQLDTWPLLAVIGPSGVGKSSFVHAGLVPAVRARGGNWQVGMLRPGRTPLHRLATMLADSLATGDDPGALMAELVESPGAFGAALRRAAARHDARILIVVDQLEELFTLCDSDKIRSLFLSALLGAADDPSSPVRVVLSMRADFVDRLALHPEFLAQLSRGLFFLAAPDRESLRETLERPAELAGYRFEDPSIVTDMMQAASSRGALPLLSFAASRLWEARDRRSKLLPVDAYHEMGGVGGAFAQHADRVASTAPAKSQLLLRAILLRLVTPEGTRAVVDQRELVPLSRDPQEVARVLDHLVRARLVHMQTDADQVVTVELVHETLITEWPTFARWLEASHASRAFVHELRQAAKQWQARGKPDDLVWRGATAQEALGHAKRNVLELSALEAEFLSAIRRQVTRGRRRKVLAFAAIFTALGLVIAGGSVAVVKIKLAEDDAQAKAVEAERARAQVQAQLDQLRRADEAKAAAEANAKANAAEASKANETVAAQQHDLSKASDQLQETNRALRQQVVAAQAAQQKAEQATAEARAAKKEVEVMLAKERARAERAENQLRAKGVMTDDLLGGKQ